MSDDLNLVKRLQIGCSDDCKMKDARSGCLCAEAADAIERLTAERDAAWEAGAKDMKERVLAAARTAGEIPENNPCFSSMLFISKYIYDAIRALATSKPE